MELFKACDQWATRPDDERFWNLEEALAATQAYRRSAATSSIDYGDLRVQARDGDLALMGKTGVPARLTHWSFGQLSQRAGAPPSYLRKLPATLAAQNINVGLKARGEDEEDQGSARLLFHRNGGLVLRALTSEKYKRIWNCDVLPRLIGLREHGWRVPPARPATNDPRARPATEADIMSRRGGILSVNVGDLISPAGIYASDHDMFVFMVNEESAIDDGSEDGLARGFFVGNSEVGAASFWIMTFLYKHVCGNHIVWDASDVKELRVRHVGAKAEAEAFDQIRVQLVEYANESASDTEAKIKAARTKVLGATKEEVLDMVFGFARKKSAPLSRRVIGQAYDVAEEYENRYGDPNTVWGVVNGLTQVATTIEHADERLKLDRAAGRVMEMAF